MGEPIRAHFGELEGREAAVAMIALTEGRYFLVETEVDEGEAIATITGLLLEAARLQDESSSDF